MATRSWNRVELIGNLTRDPELRYTPSGAAVVTFSIATNRTFVSDGEKREEVDFHRCVAWNKLAELCSQLLKKGNRVFVSGRLQNRSWEGQDGQSRNVTEIVIEDMIVLTSRNDAGSSYASDEDTSARAVDRPAEEMPKSQKSDVRSQKSEKVEEPAKAAEVEEPEEAPSKATAEKVETEDPGNLDDLPF